MESDTRRLSFGVSRAGAPAAAASHPPRETISIIGTLNSFRMATMSACRRSITESRVAWIALSRCRTPMAMLRANGMPDTGSESGSATIVSGTAACLTQYPANGPHTIATSIESFATASTMSSGWSAGGAGRVGGWGIGVVVADQVDTDLQVLEDRVVERSDRQPPIGAIYEIVGGAVVRLGRRAGAGAHRRLPQHVTESREDRVAQIAPALGPPEIDHRRVQVLGDQVGDLVFEALFLVVGEGHLVRVDAHFQLGGGARGRAGEDGERSGGDQRRSAQFPPRVMHNAPVESWRRTVGCRTYYTRRRSAFAPTPGAPASCDTATPSRPYGRANTISVPPALLMLV